MTNSSQRALAGACIVLLSACSSIKDLGIPWVSQAPGMTPEEAKGKRDARQTPGGADSGASTARTTPPPAPQAKKAEPGPAPLAQAPSVRSGESPATSREVAAPAGGYPQAARYGDLLFISGQIPIDPRTLQGDMDAKIEEQTRVAMENLRAVLEANRLTMANVVSTTVYLKNINDLAGMDTVYVRYFKTALPARSVVEVARLPRGALVEISAVAGR